MPRKDYISTLDGLRGIACLLVLWAHLPRGVLYWRLDAISPVLGPGTLGVDIFFVLSGFLITRILLSNKLAGVPLHYFLARRALRIFPIYYLTLLVVYVASRRPDVIWSAVYLSNFHYSLDSGPNPLGTTWSLAVEEHFYLFWPLVVYLMSVRNSRRVAGMVLIPGALLCAVAAILLLEPLHAGVLIYRGTMCRMASLALGALLAFHENRVRQAPWRTAVAASVAVMIGAGGIAFGHAGLAGGWSPLVRLSAYACVSVGIVMAVITLHEVGGPMGWWLRNRPLRYVGRISYGLYLYHYPIYFALGLHLPRDVHTHTLTMALWGLSLTFLVAASSWVLIESPILRLKSRFQTDPARTSQAAVDSTLPISTLPTGDRMAA